MEENCKNSAGIILINYDFEVPKFLLLRAYSYWDFPKGGAEKGEDYKAAATREVKEETGIVNFEFIHNETYTTEAYGNPKKKAHYFLAKTSEKKVEFSINPELGKAEHDEFQWLTYEEALKKLNPRVSKALTWAYKALKPHLKNQVKI